MCTYLQTNDVTICVFTVTIYKEPASL